MREIYIFFLQKEATMQKSFIMDRSYTFFWQICQFDTFLQPAIPQSDNGFSSGGPAGQGSHGTSGQEELPLSQGDGPDSSQVSTENFQASLPGSKL